MWRYTGLTDLVNVIKASALTTIMAFGFLIHWLSESWKERIKDWFIGTPLWLKAVISAIVVIIVYQSISADMQPFIYFQF